MIFVKLGKLLAWTLLFAGAFKAVTALIVALAFFTDPEALAAATSAYIGTGTTGQAVDQGLIWVTMGIVVGLLVQIAERKTS